MGDQVPFESKMVETSHWSERKLKVRYIPEIIANESHLQLDLSKNEKATKIDRETRLVKASLVGSFEVMCNLLESGVSVDAEELNRALFYTSRNYITPLQIAACLGHVDCVNILIQYGAKLNATDKYDVTALHLAAQEGHFLCLKALLEAKADCNAATKHSKDLQKPSAVPPFFKGTTALHLAAANNHVDCTVELIKFGADYNSIDEKGRTPLYIAANFGYSENVLAQIRYAIGYDILSLPGFSTNNTPLHFAVRNSMVECVKELLQLGSDVSHLNKDGFTPLHLAVTSGSLKPEISFEVLKLIVIYGYNCDVNLKDGRGLTPLHYAAFGGEACMKRPDMAAFLIAHGANINIKNKEDIELFDYELNSDSDPEVFFAIVQTMNIPTPLSNPRNYYRPRDYYHLRLNRPRGYNGDDFQLILDQIDQEIEVELLALPMRPSRRIPVYPNVEIKRNWYSQIVTNPRTLMHSCRYVIRRAMEPNKLRRIRELSLPECLLSYLLFGHETARR
ncbi:serine/threonine-protein phosphatase 6 regulatory ankyrin repeat subunit B-like [Uloborus diversus]|uniref:serine/threonine-protein phosphatase 6 regulatory ankyrin repeat subunit B-like n=1 Tax=Uloborus diversus TaxID=327109 RepID=UPI0024093306|nr:serine/threonine-protein phosphatase 6 regulatory ankyrin repeat subunit B-like [Uloborus diversus]